MADAVMEDVPQPARSPSGLGVALDAVNLGEQGVSFGFGIARTATQMGFGVATSVLRAARLSGVEQVVEFAHGATKLGQDFAEATTQASLGAARWGLEASGAQEGELLRLTLGDEAAEAIMMVLKMVRRFCTPLSGVSTAQLFFAAQSWTILQHAARMEKLQTGPMPTALPLPPLALRWMRFSAATFGSLMMAGLADGFSVAPAMRAAAAADATPAEKALAAAAVTGRVTVVAFEEHSPEHFAPGYMVAVDHETGCVVVALRGTSSARDALVDLVCEAVPCELAGVEGQAHGGMLRAAQKLFGPLLVKVQEGLALLAAERAQGLVPASSSSGADVIVTGQSLGGGVAALLVALWRDAAALPKGCSVRCVTFGCPQVLDSGHALALSNFTTSIVLGDDLVPRLSLTTVQDLREALLRLADPKAFGLPEELSAAALSALAKQGGATQGSLAAAHAAVSTFGVRGEENRLYPAGRLIVLRKVEQSPESTYAPLEGSHEDVDELLLSSDMASAHMPARYLKALAEASLWPEPVPVLLSELD